MRQQRKQPRSSGSRQSPKLKVPVATQAGHPNQRLKKLARYDPYKVFDTRRGCITAIGLCIFMIVVVVLNAVLNQKWASLLFVLLYGWIIRNRLRKLRGMANE